MDTVALFESRSFNFTEAREEYINPSCFGDDLARWLMQEFQRRGLGVDAEPGQEDFGWYFDFTVGDEPHCLVVGGDGDGGWFLVVERACGFLASILGGRHRNVKPEAVAALADVLADSDRVEDLRWLSWETFRKRGM